MTILTIIPSGQIDSDQHDRDEQNNNDHYYYSLPSITHAILTASLTMEEDRSQPPTPDGTGLPTNFYPIGPGLYRSSYPQPAHFSALQNYNFKTIITFVPEQLAPANLTFIHTHAITHHQIHVLPNKEDTPDSITPFTTIHQIIRLMLDKRNHPLLIHCNKGKHRTGCVAACFRKVTGWSNDACIAEYERYATPKDRQLDKEFIRRFSAPPELKALALDHGFVGGAFATQQQLFRSDGGGYGGGSGVSEVTAWTAASASAGSEVSVATA